MLVLAAALPIRSDAGPPETWNGGFLDHLVGDTTMEGRILGMPVHHEVNAVWVLNRQFLCIHEKTSPMAPASERRYEAFWYMGYDAISERYVLHLLDDFGGRFSETLGFGVRDGDTLRFVFEYPDGPFHTDVTWSEKTKTWNWVMTQKDKGGKWVEFADLALSPTR